MKKFYFNAIIVLTISISTQTFAQCWNNIAAGQLHTVGVQNNGTLWAWGYNNFWQLGTGNNTSQNTPTKIGSDTNWAKAYAGNNYSMAIKQDGTLWAWGFNTSGKLGVGGTSLRTIPTQVGTATDWESIATSEGNHTLAIKTNGTLWAWGSNSFGQLGTNAASNVMQYTPIQVGTATNWKMATAGLTHSVAIKTDGTIWAWGAGGILGDTTTTNKFIPTQIGTATDWDKVSAGKRHTMAIKTNKSLFGWGDNQDGQLGNGGTSSVFTPTQIGSDLNWENFSAWENTTFGIKSNGTLWGWGYNIYGHIGDSTTTTKLNPLQIGNATNWEQVSVGQSHTAALQTTDFRASWGNNSVGQIGDITNVDKLVPTVIVCLTPLSLDLMHFSGKRVQGTHLLNWTANINANKTAYELQRSKDGMQFSTIGTIEKIGIGIQHFNFVDHQPLINKNYYRLKETQLNGDLEYSNVITLTNSDYENLYIFPNPVSNNLHIEGFTDTELLHEYRVTDHTGKVLLKGNIKANETINTASLQGGLYYLNIDNTMLKFSKF